MVHDEPRNLAAQCSPFLVGRPIVDPCIDTGIDHFLHTLTNAPARRTSRFWSGTTGKDLLAAFGGSAQGLVDLADGAEVIRQMGNAPDHAIQLYLLHFAGRP